MNRAEDVRYRVEPTPLGAVWVAWSERGLVSLGFTDQERGARRDPAWTHDPALSCSALDQLREYFAGTRRTFELPLAPAGTPFQQAVWTALSGIGYGETTSYGALAQQLGRPGAARAVGAANGQNPIAIVIPCHRVVGSDGKLRGYAGGLGRKGRLLAFERAQLGRGQGELFDLAGACP